MTNQLMQRLDSVVLNGHTNPIWLQQLQSIYVVAHEHVTTNKINKSDWSQIVTRISKIQDQFNEM